MKKKILTLLLSLSIIGSSTIIPTINTNAETLENNTQLTEIAPKEAGAFTVTANSGSNLRTGPGLSYKIITAFPKGTVLWRVNYGPTTDSTGHKWYKVKTIDNTYTGWISATTGYAN